VVVIFSGSCTGRLFLVENRVFAVHNLCGACAEL
jgi:hypothetical protein